MDLLRDWYLRIRSGIVFISVTLLLMYSMVSNAYVEERLVDSPCSRTDNQLNLGKIISYKGLAYFCSEHPEFGKEVHVTNGAEFGTSVLKDLDPGPGSSSPFGFFVYNDLLFFIAETTQTGYALWKTDGTEQGTSLVKSLPFISTDPNNDSFHAVEIAGKTSQGLFFRVDDSLIRTDGTYSGTQVIDVPIVYIRGPIGALNGSKESSYIVFNNHLYVLSIRTLYRIEPSGNSTEIITIPGSGGFEPRIYSNFSEFNGRFLIFNPASSSDETWVSNGTSAGTFLLRPDEPGGDRFIPLGVINSKLVFATHPTNQPDGQTLYATSDGAEDTALITGDFGPFSYKSLELIFGVNLITGWSDCFGYGPSIVTDGTPAGSVTLPFGPVCKTGQTGFPVNQLMTFNNRFVGFENGVLGNNTSDKIWLSDGTLSGSSLVITGGNLKPFATTSQHLFFERDNQLWSSDGSSTIKRLSAMNLTSNTNTSQRFKHYTENDRYYLVRTSDNPSENFILHSNGTITGTYTLKYTFENGLPEPEPIDSNWLVPILMLLKDEEIPLN